MDELAITKIKLMSGNRSTFMSTSENRLIGRKPNWNAIVSTNTF